ncbi:MAG: PEP-CTERM sorting domain-containing protein [Proteobacteria bacterium]|nr:PEP-CTERM sorting domain-containing protein [Pseudomonadota bacterium]MBU4295717.1 PEP-CTERM sorting domain-containing protein [Pseudomonadota bacterium]MCG2747222.1 PEP-CTERM sorting domain-containing protein [Desulfobulbaceae bacterium]
MKRTMLWVSKKYAVQVIAALVIASAACQTANADPITTVFNSTWTQIAAEDYVGPSGYVNPGYGGQDFDAEYLYYKRNGNTLSIGLQSGFNLVTGRVDYGGKAYYAGDLALSFDNNISSYEYAFDFGLLTKDYYVNLVDADPAGSSDGIDASGLYAVTQWNNGVYFTAANPFAMDGGSQIESGATSAGYDSTLDSYWRIVSFDITSIGNFAALDAHWTMSCGNDVIDGHAAAPVPEPATMLLFGTGISGLAAWQRRKFRKA